MAYQVNFDPELFMTAGVKADQQRIAPFKQGFSKLSSALSGVVDRMREKEAQRLFEEDVRNRAQWKKLKDQLANPEYEEYEEEVRFRSSPRTSKSPKCRPLHSGRKTPAPRLAPHQLSLALGVRLTSSPRVARRWQVLPQRSRRTTRPSSAWRR